MLLFTCNYVVSVWRGFLFLWVLGMNYAILLWHSLAFHIIIMVVLEHQPKFIFAFTKTFFSVFLILLPKEITWFEPEVRKNGWDFSVTE